MWSGDQCLCAVEISLGVVWRSVLLCDGVQCCCGMEISINVELCCLLGSVLMWNGDQC